MAAAGPPLLLLRVRLVARAPGHLVQMAVDQAICAAEPVRRATSSTEREWLRWADEALGLGHLGNEDEV